MSTNVKSLLVAQLNGQQAAVHGFGDAKYVVSQERADSLHDVMRRQSVDLPSENVLGPDTNQPRWSEGTGEIYAGRLRQTSPGEGVCVSQLDVLLLLFLRRHLRGRTKTFRCYRKGTHITVTLQEKFVNKTQADFFLL